jgi:hypothetical protein
MALQTKLDTGNCGQVAIKGCGQALLHRQMAEGEGVGPAGKGHRNGGPANIFYFLFF